ncbi:MAG: hypothetical protein KJP19_08635 [Deltaproteobacteria bacterium]|nr:hypothetical protein [Deltaproteobacteria bacterium]
MKKSHLKLSIISILSLIMVPAYFVSPAVAIQYSCEETPGVSISATNDKMVDHACNAADRAIRFLGKYHLQPQRAIYIEIIEEIISRDGYKALGSYDRQSDRILMMSLPALLQSSKSPKMYNMPFDEEHYIGALAHEITHAIFHHNSKKIEEKWNNAAQEYLAHATQLGVLAAQRREEIINSEDTGPWEPGDEISVTYMGFNTTGFAVKSYLHLTQMTDPQSFIQILLNHKWLYISVP